MPGEGARHLLKVTPERAAGPCPFPNWSFPTGSTKTIIGFPTAIRAMDEDIQEATPESEDEMTEDAAPRKPQPISFSLAVALALVGFLVLLILFSNVPGIRASASVSITRSDWILQSYADMEGMLIPVGPGTPVTAAFGRDGRVSGSAGCNRYSADYTIHDFAISISPPISTKIYCGNPVVMQQESAYLKNLARALELRISESTLTLYDRSGKPVLVFVN